MNFSVVIYRKLLAGFLSAIIFTFIMTLVFILGPGANESLGGGIIGISLIISFYVIPVIILYGITISLGIEYIFVKKMIFSNVFYIALHSVFGMASYFIFWKWGGVLFGIIVAFLFASIDRWLSRFGMTNKLIILSIVLPIGFYALGTLLIAAFGSNIFD